MTVLLARTRGPSRPSRTSSPSPGPTIPVETWDGTFDRSRAHLDHRADPTRARRILGTELRYIDHPSFDDPGAHDAILAPMPAPDVVRAPRRTEASAKLYDGSFSLEVRGDPGAGTTAAIRIPLEGCERPAVREVL
jgi:hypothetical protein